MRHARRSLAVLALLIAACQQTDSLAPATPTAVTITASATTVPVGGTLTLSASASANGIPLQGVSTVWSSSDAAIATVNSSGVVTGVSRGSATIAAAVGNARGTVGISVIGLKTLTLAPSTVTMTPGQSVSLTATVDADPGVSAPVTWASSNAAIATVSATGAITAVAAGSTVITATALGRSVAATVTVVLPTVATVNVSPVNASLIVGQSQQFTTTPRDSVGNAISGRTTVWSTSNASVGSISATGLLSAVAPGTVTVQATIDGRVGNATVTIAPTPVASLSVAPTTATLRAGRTTALTATARDRNGAVLSSRLVTWRTSNAAVATVDALGTVTGVAIGTALVTAECEGSTATATITVEPTVAAVALTPASAALTVGQTQAFTAGARDAAGAVITGRAVTWSTGNASVATISATGVLTALATGTVTVQGIVEGVVGSATVTITPSPVASLTLSASSVALLVGRTTVLTATARDQNGTVLTGRNLSWRSSNNVVATVDASGVVTAVATGSAVITADCEGKTATVAVTVTQTQVASIEPYFGITIAAGDTASLYFVPKNAAGQVVTGEGFTISVDGSDVQARTTQCGSEGCLQRIESSVFANVATVSHVTRTVTIRPSAVPAGGTPNTQITVRLIGNLADSLAVNAGTSPLPGTPVLNSQYTVFPYLYLTGVGGFGNVHLRNAEFAVTAGAATLRRCIQGSTAQNYQSHCMMVTPTTTGPFSLQIRQRKADGSFWITTWTAQVIP